MKGFFLALVLILAFCLGIAVVFSCDDDDDDDNDTTGDDDATDDDDDDDSAQTADDCMAQFGEDMLDCADQVQTSTRKESAYCVLDSMDAYVDCLESVGACDATCECLDDCHADAVDCVDLCGENDDPCLDACNDLYDACIQDCGWGQT